LNYVDSGYIDAGYIGVPGSGVKFALGAQTLNFEQAPLRPPRDIELIQADALSAGGRRFGFAIIAAEDILVLSWPRLLGYYRERLIDWFNNVADGMAISFTYVDKDGVERSVRIADPQLPEIRQIAGDRYAVQIRLLVDP